MYEEPIHALSSWLILRDLIERENIHAPVELQNVDAFIFDQAYQAINSANDPN